MTEEASRIVPVKDAAELSTEAFFNLMAQLMVDNPPSADDEAIVKEMASVGIAPGKKFDASAFSEEARKKLQAIPGQAHDEWRTKLIKGDPDWIKNNWLFIAKDMGAYGTNYELRAFVAFVGLGANLPQDAIYPTTSIDADGKLLVGSNNYVMHFDKENLPAVKGFWSLTVYDETNFLIENPINRFAVGDRDNLKYSDDGSLDIYIQTSSPGAARESNWLPTPKDGKFNLTLRLYWPGERIVDRTWAIPAITKVEE